jgi:chromosome segregation ATPase
MQNVTIRLREDLLDDLDQEADEEGVSRSEYVRDILEDRHRADDLEGEVERLRERLGSREDRVEDLEEQLARRSQIEEKVEEVAMEVRQQSDDSDETEEDAPFPIRWWRWWQRRQE